MHAEHVGSGKTTPCYSRRRGCGCAIMLACFPVLIWSAAVAAHCLLMRRPGSTYSTVQYSTSLRWQLIQSCAWPAAASLLMDCLNASELRPSCLSLSLSLSVLQALNPSDGSATRVLLLHSARFSVSFIHREPQVLRVVLGDVGPSLSLSSSTSLSLRCTTKLPASGVIDFPLNGRHSSLYSRHACVLLLMTQITNSPSRATRVRQSFSNAARKLTIQTFQRELYISFK